MKNFPGGRELIVKLHHWIDWKYNVHEALTAQNLRF